MEMLVSQLAVCLMAAVFYMIALAIVLGPKGFGTPKLWERIVFIVPVLYLAGSFQHISWIMV